MNVGPAFYRSVVGGADPHFGSVSLLLHGEGADGSTSFVDSSSFGRSGTANDGVIISTSQARFGTASIRCDDGGSSADWVGYSTSTDFGMDADATIEMFVRFSSLNAGGNFFCGATDGSNVFLLDVGGGVASRIRALFMGVSVVALADSVVNTWYHVAAVLHGSTLRLFIEGAQQGTASLSGSRPATLPLQVGSSANRGIARGLNGFIDEFRFTKGVARYTADFTPPSAAFPDS